MKTDLVSIITPTYNCGRFIAETIESVQAQTYTNWEMIIIDDCSTDHTDEIVAMYSERDSRIKYHCLKRNSGAAIARNTALRMAVGRWIAFLDSDDLWHPEKLERQVKFMIDNGYAFTYTQNCNIDENGKELGVKRFGPKRITRRGMYNYCWIGCLTVMYDASVVGLIQIDDIKKNNDYALWLKVCRKANCYLMEMPLAFYRVDRKGAISNADYHTLIKWLYKLHHECDRQPVLMAVFNTVRNLFFGVIKKLYYKERY